MLRGRRGVSEVTAKVLRVSEAVSKRAAHQSVRPTLHRPNNPAGNTKRFWEVSGVGWKEELQEMAKGDGWRSGCVEMVVVVVVVVVVKVVLLVW
ncbi:hypothetical protein E2C01_028625 [Portunus trituberculatus]|uniref:Uncharacterized protein n=1 Tax=Portunus trituberculatus TaxID=210409 RepID=A0A5B7EPI3_PORTR|nr:hypothetical protein [Portunus trituberculatus]